MGTGGGTRSVTPLMLAAALLAACGDDGGAAGPRGFAAALGNNRVANIALKAGLDSAGNIYVVGKARSALFGTPKADRAYGGFLAKYNPRGALLWGQQLTSAGADVSLSGVALAGAQVFAAGTTAGPVAGRAIPDRQDGFVAGYDAGGTRQWVQIVGAAAPGPDAGVTVLNMAAGGGATVYVAGTASGGVAFGNRTGARIGTADGFIVPVTSGGAPAGDLIVLGAPGGVTAITGLATDSAGDLYASGYTSAALGGQRLTGTTDAFVAKYSAAGVPRWLILFGAAQATTIATDIAYSPRNGALYVGGYSTTSQSGEPFGGTRLPFVASHSAATGARNWLVEPSVTERRSETLAVAADAEGNLYAAGYTERDIYRPAYESFYDATLAKFDASGRLVGGTQFGTSRDTAAACFWGLAPGGNRVVVVGSSTFGLDPDNPDPTAGGSFAIVKTYAKGGIGR